MSVVVKDHKSGQIKLLTKGADAVLFKLLAHGNNDFKI